MISQHRIIIENLSNLLTWSKRLLFDVVPTTLEQVFIVVVDCTVHIVSLDIPKASLWNLLSTTATSGWDS